MVIIQMSIIYCVIVRQDDTDNQVPLCSYDCAHGNYPAITEQILKKVKLPHDISYKYNQEYIYHIKTDENLLFVCLADTTLSTSTAFLFLQHIRNKFKQKYSPEDIAFAYAYAMNASFSEILKQQLIYHNSNRDAEKKHSLNMQLERLQLQMDQNIEKVLQREEKVEMTVKKAAKLDSIAQQVKQRAGRVDHTFCSRHKCKLLALGGVLAAAAILIVI